MLDGIVYLLAAQNFPKRMSQFRKVEQLPANSFNERWIVKHELTGKKLELKSVDITDTVNKNFMLK